MSLGRFLTALTLGSLCAIGVAQPASAQEADVTAETEATVEATSPEPSASAPGGDAPTNDAFNSDLEAAASLFGESSPKVTPAQDAAKTPADASNNANDGEQESVPAAEVTPADIPAAGAASGETKIEPMDDFDAAVQRAQLAGRPLLAIFGATWCTWCRRLESDLGSADAESVLRQWVVVKVDVDEKPELAERFQATSLPALRILTSVQSVVASREGYLEPAELQAWLTEHRTKADTRLHRVLFAAGDLNEDEVRQLIELLGDSAPAVRTAAIERLVTQPSRTASPVTQVMGKQRLMQQLAAREVLLRWRAPVGDLDPWRPETWTDDRLQTLARWAEEMQSNGKDVLPPVQDAPGSDEAAQDGLRRLLASSIQERQATIQQLVGLATRVQPLVGSMLASNESLTDEQRESLRELKYHLLSGSAFRLEHGGLLSALARLDANAHRQAAIAVGDKVTSDDHALLDELAIDSDPTVREVAIRTLGKLKLLAETDRLARYLQDENSNVRIAILQALTESPEEATLKIVCDYLIGEQDEDLLVRGIKYLATLGPKSESFSVLARLARHSDWQVRAAVLEAVKPIMEADGEIFLGGDDDTDEEHANQTELAAAVVACVRDADPFVTSRAIEALPHVLSRTNANEIANVLSDRPELLDGALVEAFQSSSNLSLLTDVAVGWIEQADEEKLQRGAKLLTVLSPDALKEKLPTLLQSQDLATRLDGLRATMQLIDQYRQAELTNREELHWRASESTPIAIEPWFASEQLFTGSEAVASQETADEAAKAELTESRASEVATEVAAPDPVEAELDVVDNFFGDTADAIDETNGTNGTNGTNETNETAETEEDEQADPAAEGSPKGPGIFGAMFRIAASLIDPTDDPLMEATVQGMPMESSATLSKWSGERPSDWMAAWNRHDGALRPSWLESCLEPIERSRASDDVSEQLHARIVSLMLGESEDAMRLLQDIELQRSDNSSGLKRLHEEILLRWLPADAWMTFARRHLSAEENEQRRILVSLQTRLLIDDRPTAVWILDELAPSYAKSLEERLVCGEWLATALLGSRYQNNYQASSAVQIAKTRPYRVLNASSVANEHEAECNWLRDQFQHSSVDRAKAITLAALVRLNYPLAVDAALGILQESDQRHRKNPEVAEAYPETIEMAMAILASGPAHATANLSVMLLEHADPTVRRRAAIKLAQFSRMYSSNEYFLAVYEENPSLPYYFYATEHVSAERLDELASELGEDEAAPAVRWLQMATDPKIDGKPWLDTLRAHFGPQSPLAIATAFAKCERTDAEALTLYRSLSQSPDLKSEPFHGTNDAQRQVYVILQELKHPDVMELRRELRERYGAGVLQN